MDTARASVVNAVTGAHLLHITGFDCRSLVQDVRAALGHRPTRQIILLHEGAVVDEGLRISPGQELAFEAVVISTPVTPVARAEFVRALSLAHHVTHVFRNFPKEARDDDAIVMEAVELCPWCLGLASKSCRNNRDIVLRAVGRDGWVLQHASEACQDDKEIVLEAVCEDPASLRWASEACRGDKEIVLEAVCQDPASLQWASEACRGDREVVLEALRAEVQLEAFGALVGDPWHSSDDKDLWMDIVSQYPWSLQCASEAIRNDEEIVYCAKYYAGLTVNERHVALEELRVWELEEEWGYDCDALHSYRFGQDISCYNCARDKRRSWRPSYHSRLRQGPVGASQYPRRMLRHADRPRWKNRPGGPERPRVPPKEVARAGVRRLHMAGYKTS